MTEVPDGRRNLPSVDALLSHDGLLTVLDREPRALVRRAVREVLDEERQAWLARRHRDREAAVAALDELLARIMARVEMLAAAGLRRVINATGVVVHTNLGRSPLSTAACRAVHEAARGYSTLEYDLAAGERGSRLTVLRALLVELTGAGDAMVVNNNAAALVLVLSALAAGREVVVSRGELVEIGGSFRLPEIMQRSGARLVEVGTTNRTRADDYRRAIGPDTALLLKVHRSNFSMHGFVEEATLTELVEVGRERGVPVVEDLGSGALVDLEPLGIGREPTVSSSLKAGAQVVTVSGDKLLGGPQAGILLGEAAIIRRLLQDPLARALRLDKMTIAALEATLRVYRDPDRASAELPTLRMLTRPAAEIEQAAGELVAALRARRPGIEVEVVPTRSQVGGGAQPEARIASFGVALTPPPGTAVDALAAGLRGGSPPIVGRIEMNRLILDLRTISPDEADEIVDGIVEVLGAPGPSGAG
jgi:L-seryl-tRNA(Ser) seleniumtransferase